MLAIMVAMDENRGIGKDNELLCNLPSDMDIFKAYTTDKTVVMGRKTYESIGKPLPNRKNIMLTTDTNITIEGLEIVNSIDEILELAKKEYVVIIGGASVYEQFVDKASLIHISHIHNKFEGVDTFFPVFNEDDFTVVEEVNFDGVNGNDFGFTYRTYSKIENRVYY